MRPGRAGARPARLTGACWRLPPPPGPLGAGAGRVTVVARVNRSTGCAMNDRESPGVTLLTDTAGPGRTGRQSGQLLRGRPGSARIEGGELPERPRPEVAGIVDMLAPGQRRDAAALGRARRN